MFPIAAALWASSLLAQDFTGVQVERFAWGFTYTEGPVWMRDGSLVFSDVPANLIYRVKPGEKAATLRADSNGAMGNAVDAQGRLYTCETHSRRVVRVNKNGALDVLAERFEGKRLNAPNDIAVRKDGQIYFTDPAFGNQQDTRELDFYGVYRIAPSGELSVIAKPKGRPNGIALSPDGKTLYVSNSDERNVRAYALDRKGAATNERILVTGIDGVPDGVRTDEYGNLYVMANAVLVFTPQGLPLATVQLDDTPSNCAFGDEDLHTLFVTARTAVYRIRVPFKGWTPYAQP